MTEVTDEMVKRAATEFLSYKGENPYRVLRRGAEMWENDIEAMRAALNAALAVAPKPRVKALEWYELYPGHVTATPTYWREGYTIVFTGPQVSWQFNPAMEWHDVASIDEAKSVVQSDYERRALEDA